jgi:ribosomal protein S18 acetylase RimI-like enzyme
MPADAGEYRAGNQDASRAGEGVTSVMARPVLIRPARIADAAAIGAVHVQTWRAAYEGIVATTFLTTLSAQTRAAQWQQTLVQPRAGLIVLVAETGDRDIVGFVAAGPERSGDPGHAGEIYALYVLPSQQRSGIGHSLPVGRA